MNESNEKKNPLLVPGSIIFAGILIAGAVMYVNGGAMRPATTRPTSNGEFSYSKLAAELGLDEQVFTTCFESRKYKAEVEKDLQDGISAGVQGTPATFVNGRLVSGAVPYSVLKKAIEEALNGTTVAGGPSADDDVILGDPTAPVTLITFGDYQCPFCEQLYRTGEREARDEYVATGKVKMVYRDFPLTSIHPAAVPAAEAAQCAGDQGKFWAYHDALYERQAQLK